MNREALIKLVLEKQQDCVLISSPQFPLLQLQLAIEGFDERIIENCVLPVLKEMVEYRVGDKVELRLIRDLSDIRPEQMSDFVPPHVIAQKISLRDG